MTEKKSIPSCGIKAVFDMIENITFSNFKEQYFCVFDWYIFIFPSRALRAYKQIKPFFSLWYPFYDLAPHIPILHTNIKLVAVLFSICLSCVNCKFSVEEIASKNRTHIKFIHCNTFILFCSLFSQLYSPLHFAGMLWVNDENASSA